jgi:hypothetical protein
MQDIDATLRCEMKTLMHRNIRKVKKNQHQYLEFGYR